MLFETAVLVTTVLVVDPIVGVGAPPPVDSAVLFDGSGVEAWRAADGAAVRWPVRDGVLVVDRNAGDIVSARSFGDVRLHVEWRVPPGGVGQRAGNSGVKLMRRYEVQILDSTPAPAVPARNGAGALYGLKAADVNAARPAGQWQAYDVWFRAPRFRDGEKIASAEMTVYWNGQLVHEDVVVPGPTGVSRADEIAADGVLLQAHGSDATEEVAFRNIWVVPLPPPASKPAVDVAPGFVDLFDGVSLAGWHQLGGGAVYTVEDGVIVGRTRPHEPNSFLCTDKVFGDFVLELEFMVDDELNSGIQIRSQQRAEGDRTRVYGYQVEIDPSPRAWSAGIYDEGRRGWLQDLTGNVAARVAFRPRAWNRLRVEARGPHLRTFLNDVPAAGLDDDLTPAGFIGLQVHGVGNRVEPLAVRWRRIRLQRLDAE